MKSLSMGRPGGIFVIAAIILGGLTAYAVYDYIQRTSTVQAGPAPVTVFVALTDIPSRQEIKAEMIGQRKVSPHDVIPGTVNKLEDIVGKITLTPIKAFEQFRQKDLAPKNKVPGLSYQIPPGMRAITIAISDTRGVAGAIFPGDRVDILCSLRDPRRGQSVVQVPLQNLLVIAVDAAKTETDTGAKQSLTLCVKPEEAQVLTAAEESGGHAIRVILRSKDDQAILDDRAVSLDKYLKSAPKVGEEPAPEEPAAPAAAPQKKIKIYDGGKVSEFSVP